MDYKAVRKLRRNRKNSDRRVAEKNSAKYFIEHASNEDLTAMLKVLSGSKDIVSFQDSILGNQNDADNLSRTPNTFRTYRYATVSFILNSATKSELADLKELTKARLKLGSSED